MDIELSVLVDDVVERVRRALRAKDHSAIVVMEGRRTVVLSDSAYLRGRASAEDFERRAAADARTVAADRLALAVPQVVVVTADEDAVRFRSPLTGPVREGEREAVVWMAFGVGDGVEFGMVAFTRSPDGRPVFDDPDDTVSEPLHPAAGMPGTTLLRLLLDEDHRPHRP